MRSELARPEMPHDFQIVSKLITFQGFDDALATDLLLLGRIWSWVAPSPDSGEAAGIELQMLPLVDNLTFFLRFSSRKYQLS